MTYFTISNFLGVEDGLWAIEIEGKISIREIIRIPVGKIRIMGDISFECLLGDIKIVQKIVEFFNNLN